MQLIALKSSLNAKQATSSSSEPPDAAPKKKSKPTKKPPQASSVNPLARPSTDINTIPAGGSCVPLSQRDSKILTSLHTLEAISTAVSTKSAPQPDPVFVVEATTRCIDALNTLLMDAVSPASEAPRNPTPKEAISGMERTLPHVLSTAVSTLGCAYSRPSRAASRAGMGDDIAFDSDLDDLPSAVDAIFGRVSTRILVPAVHAFVPCTLARVEHILLGPELAPTEAEPVDVADLLSLIAAVLRAFPNPELSALHDRTALEAIRALAALIQDRVHSAQPSPSEHIHRIARKDALHHLCEVALLSLSRLPLAPLSSPQEILRVGLGDALGELALALTPREGTGGLDVVEEHRMMVVLERAWSVGLRVGSVSCDTDDAMDVDCVSREDGEVTVMGRDWAGGGT
ncbi:hypothetical protein BC834DRAFT_389782 [Gloeopeniophorella convolvens]|nr:hypothetical protein BC834DRAFT_389782 [Gloeopeniophorella convolvens]